METVCLTDQDDQKRASARIDQKRFEERYPHATELVAKLREHFGIPRIEGRKLSKESLSVLDWIKNRLRILQLRETCPPRCIDRCRNLCKNPWAWGKPLPSGFCACKLCCPCCGVAHRI